MKLICGLGNPGKEYANTRHNVGFMIIDNYCHDEKWSSKYNGLYIEENIFGEKVIFLKPQSYMNLSGNVVKPFVDYYKIKLEDVLIIRDDLDLGIGRARIKYNSSSGGDNGVKSIIANLGSQMFYQYKIGISNDKTRDTKDYVLGRFSKEEIKVLDEIIDDSSKIIDSFIKGEIQNNIDFKYGE
jgi:PTH1 family peptidyl-tRNA hydrolase